MIKNFLQFKESFVPKNIEKRKEDLKKIKEKELKELNELAIKVSETIKGFKDIKIEDEREHFFINKFVDCQVKDDNNKLPNKVFFFDQKGKYLANYDLKNNIFWIGDDYIWSKLASNYTLNDNQIKSLSKAWVEEHFKLRHVITRKAWF